MGAALVERQTGLVVKVNGALLGLLNASAAEVVGRPISDQRGWHENGSSHSGEYEVTLDLPQGPRRHLAVTRQVVDTAGTPCEVLFVRDLTELRLKEEHARTLDSQLWYQAHHDPLTGLPNRTSLHARLDELLRELPADPAPADAAAQPSVCLAQLDFTGLEEVDSAHGYAAGDLAQQALARRLRDHLPPGGLAAHTNGSLFALTFACSGSEQGMATLRQLAERLDAEFTVQGHLVSPRLRAGISWAPAHGQTADALIRTSLSALSYARGRSGATLEAYRPALDGPGP
ncbi:diguanylate cyclase [Deinococcus sp. HMF7604]|uniref:sensor domain-containing diguanylate cyclase n=1 Tax=Deinococcus betulae TaxID=2873312 RepID=UPI001CCAAA63|nr:diguanylate cyclase [Deinococcus betulae]